MRTNGEQFVKNAGTCWMAQWCADNWDLLPRNMYSQGHTLVEAMVRYGWRSLDAMVMKVRCWIVEMQGWTWENQIALINRTLVWSVTKRLLVSFPQIHYMYKGLWDGAYGLSSLSEKTRKSNRLRMLSQREHFLLSYLKTLSVGPAGVWTYGLPLSRPALIPLS